MDRDVYDVETILDRSCAISEQIGEAKNELLKEVLAKVLYSET